MDTSVERLTRRRTQHVERIEHLREQAGERDLTEDERTLVREAQGDIDDIDEQLELLTREVDMSDEARNRIARVSAGVEPVVRYRSSGEVLYDLLHQDQDSSRARYRSALTRAAEHMGFDATTTEATAGDLQGVTIVPKVGAVTNPLPRRTPFLTALNPVPMTAYSFERPYLTDPDFEAGAAEQATEKSELASEKFDVDASPVKGKTYGGYLNVSLQLRTFSPGSLQIILNQLRRRVDRKLEAAAVAGVAASAGTQDLAAAATGKELNDAIYDAAVKVWNATDEPASWILMGPLGWARFGKAVDAADRPLFPMMGAANANGQVPGVDPQQFAIAPGGLRPIVSGAVADDTFWMGNEYSVEAYRYDFPMLESVEASVLGSQIAVANALVIHRPEPTKDSAIHLRPAV